jgi:phosphoglycerate dehydrogenase-like enzyme
MLIVFHGDGTSPFAEGFARQLEGNPDVRVLPEILADETDKQTYASADVIVTFKFNTECPRPEHLKLLHVPGTDCEGIDLTAVPSSAVICNCFGHEQAIAEYVMAAFLMHQIPFGHADRNLRKAQWTYFAGPAAAVHGELTGKTAGLLGFGHIGRAVAERAKAFEMKVHVANRTLVPVSDVVDRSFLLGDLRNFWPLLDFLVVALPLTTETRGIVDAEAFASMRSTAVVVNVGRGPTIDEGALFHALRDSRIAGATIDAWYNYPAKDSEKVFPSTLPFHELQNVVMTPHMSAWTEGTIHRRQETIAINIGRCMRGESCVNVVRPASS